jgi:hypothetical protein
MKRKRTQALYTNLYKNPKALFPPHASSGGVDTILFPNGQNEIWFKSADGTLGFKMTVGNGPVGLGIHISAMIGTPKITMFYADSEGKTQLADDSYIDACQYYQTPMALDFKESYRGSDLDGHYKRFPRETSVQMSDVVPEGEATNE